MKSESDIEEIIPTTKIITKDGKIKEEIFYSENEVEFSQNDEDEKDVENDDQQTISVLEMYNCNSCGISFHSIEEHVKQYHAEQEIIVEVEAEPDDNTENLQENITNFSYDDQMSFKNEPEPEQDEIEIDPLLENDQYEVEYLDEEMLLEDLIFEETTPIFTTTPHKSREILTEECLDSEGRKYNRKIVKIQKFWEINEDDIPQEESSVKTTAVKSKPIKKEENSKKKSIYKCKSCEIEYTSAKALSGHSRVHKTSNNVPESIISDNNFDCSICNTKFLTNKSLRLHLRMHDPIKPKTMEALDFEEYLLNTADNPDPQLKQIQLTKKFRCNVCNNVYDKKFKDIHMHMHSDVPKFHCSICNKKFTNDINLQMHIKVHQEYKTKKTNDINNPKPYPCSYCGREFSRPHEKVKHERIHTGEKPHKCDVCGKTFRVSYCLTLHMRTHSNLRPYVCPHCNKRFKAHSVYNHHLMTHSNLRPYQCTFCPKAFKTSVQLAGHKNSHTKPFSCTICNRPFATLYAVRSHMENHKRVNHNLKHECTICGAVYARSFALRDHIKEHHDVTADNTETEDFKEIHLNLNENNDEEDDDPDNNDIKIEQVEYDQFETEEINIL